jgi:hypothetical protein
MVMNVIYFSIFDKNKDSGMLNKYIFFVNLAPRPSLFK